ncbi:hypothetical protein ACN27F_02830 [Solwaraspora sp. WMMB335]|uniref:hypothetical protein n=1 Tax=Solwaraspora sp. WMMB335 TaxID=3404118 RepID=UPI003B93E852
MAGDDGTPSIDNIHWNQWTFVMVLKALTGTGLAIDDVLQGPFVEWNGSFDGEKGDAQGDWSYHAWEKAYFSITVNHDAIRNLKDRMEQITDVVGMLFTDKAYDDIDLNTLTTARDMIYQFQRTLDTLADGMHQWVAQATGPDGPLDGKAVDVLRTRAEGYAKTLDRWVNQINDNYGSSLPSAFYSADNDARTLVHLLKVLISDITIPPFNSSVADTISRLPEYAIGVVKQKIWQQMYDKGLLVAHKDTYQLDNIWQYYYFWSGFDESTAYEAAETYIRQSLSAVPELGNVMDPQTWIAINREIADRLAEVRQNHLDEPVRSSIERTHERYEVLGRSFPNLADPIVAEANMVEWGPCAFGNGPFGNLGPNDNPFDGLFNNMFCGMDDNPFDGLFNNMFCGMDDSPFDGLFNNMFCGMDDSPADGLFNDTPFRALVNGPDGLGGVTGDGQDVPVPNLLTSTGFEIPPGVNADGSAELPLGLGDEVMLGPNGAPALGPNGELIGTDGQSILGPNGLPIFSAVGGGLNRGPNGQVIGPNGQPVLGPNGELLDIDGTPILGPNGELIGPDRTPILGPNGEPVLGNADGSEAGGGITPPNLPGGNIATLLPELSGGGGGGGSLPGIGAGVGGAGGGGGISPPQIGDGSTGGGLGEAAQVLSDGSITPIAGPTAAPTPMNPDALANHLADRGISTDGSGGMPFYPPMGGMGGMGGQPNRDDRERQTWLTEDEAVWGTAVGAASGVIGRPDEDDDDSVEELVLLGPVRGPRPGPKTDRRRPGDTTGDQRRPRASDEQAGTTSDQAVYSEQRN